MRLALALASTALAVVAFVPAASASPSAHNGRIAFAHIGSKDRFQIYTVTPSGTERRELTSGRRYSSYSPAYSPNGKRIVFVRASKQRDLWSMGANGSEPYHLTWTKAIDEIDPSWSPDGTTSSSRSRNRRPCRGSGSLGLGGRPRQRLTTLVSTRIRAGRPTEATIVFQRASSDAGNPWWQVYVVPAIGGTATNLTNNLAFGDTDPSWSPDGSHIIFSSDRQGESELDLWVMNADGSGAHQITHTPSRNEHDASWSPDGVRIVYSSVGAFHGASSEQLQVARRSGAHARFITHSCGDCAYFNGYPPSWQPLR